MSHTSISWSLVSTRDMKKERECFYHQKHLINFRLLSLKQLPLIFIFFKTSKNCKNTPAAAEREKKKKATKTTVYKKYWHLINRLQQQHHSDTIDSILTRIPHDNSTSSDWAIITSHITAQVTQENISSKQTWFITLGIHRSCRFRWSYITDLYSRISAFEIENLSDAAWGEWADRPSLSLQWTPKVLLEWNFYAMMQGFFKTGSIFYRIYHPWR